MSLEIKEGKICVKGPKGELSRSFDSAKVGVEIGQRQANVNVLASDKSARSLWGATRMHIANMVEGVSKGFVKQLQIEGIGYRAALEEKTLVLQVGFTHPVRVESSDVSFSVEKNIITVAGIDKEAVAKIAARVKRVRPPEPYKGKGIRYVGEIVRKKVGKKAAAGATTSK